MRRYQDSEEELNGYVISLQKLDKAQKMTIRKGNVTIEEHSITNIEEEEFEIRKHRSYLPML